MGVTGRESKVSEEVQVFEKNDPKRKHNPFRPLDLFQKSESGQAKRVEKAQGTLLEGLGMILNQRSVGAGGAGAGASDGAGAGSGTVSLEARRLGIEERKHKVETLRTAWMDAKDAVTEGYCDHEAIVEAYKAYTEAVKQ